MDAMGCTMGCYENLMYKRSQRVPEQRNMRQSLTGYVVVLGSLTKDGDSSSRLVQEKEMRK
eukprot:m.304215 g.304215  ORF g.304215 m.304215 type:complete len:61 (-) comp15896_c0_seq2:465-647(-)